MATLPENPVARVLLEVLAPDGSPRGNAALRYQVAAKLEREIMGDASARQLTSG